MTHRRWHVVTLLALCLLLGGCWDHQPPENTAFILMLGLDPHPEDPIQTVVTQLAVLPSALAGAAENGGQPEGTPYYLLSANGRTIEAAQMAITDHLSRLPRLDHLDALVFSEDLARVGRVTEPAVAWALRHPQMRPGVLLFVANGPSGSAQQFLDARPALDPLPGAALAGLMRHADRVPYIFPVRAYEFARTLLSPRIDGALPLVTRTDPLSAHVPPDFQQQPYVGAGTGAGGGAGPEPMDSQIKLLGMAIFKGRRMVGALMGQDADGLIWIRGESKAAIAIQHPIHPEYFIAANTIDSSAKRSVRLEDDNRVTLVIEVKAEIDVLGEAVLEPRGVSPYAKEIEAEIAKTLEEKVRRTMQNLQTLQADIFGFGEELYRSAPRDWDRVAQVWDTLYADAELDIKAKATMRRTGLSR